MTENNNSFDDLIRKKFEGDEDAVEPSLWGSIEKQLPVANTKKRFGYWRLVALLLLISIPASVIYFYDGSDKGENKNVAQNKTEVIKQPSVVGNTISESVVQNSVKENTIEKTSAIKEIEKVNSVSKKQNEKSVTDKNKLHTTKHNVEVAAVVSSIDVNAQTPNQNSVVEPANTNVSETEIPVSTVANANIAEQNNTVAENEIANPIKNDSALSITKAEPSKPDSLVPQKIKSTHWFVELFYSPDYASKTFSLNNGDASYLKLRKNTEEFIFAHSYGIRVGYQICKNVNVKTGLDFTDVQTQLTYGYFPGQVPLPAGLKVDSIVGIVIDPLNSGIVTSHDTIVANYELVGTVAETNHYKLYNIPVMISYAIGKNKMKLETGAGGFINISSKQKGSIISDDRITRINLEEDKQRTPYKTSVGGGISAEVLMTYSIRTNIKFIIGPHAKYYLGKLNKSNAPLNEKLFTAGLLTGFRVEF